MKKHKIKELKNLLSESKNIIITAHRNPDGDAIGSSLALMHILEKLGHIVSVVFPTSYAHFLKWLPGNEKVLVFVDSKEESISKIGNADLIFCLDFNALNRLDEMEPHIKISSAQKIMIDHHQNPEDFADIIFSDTSACATAELLYSLLEELDYIHLLDEYSGTCIYTGIMTDSGSFKFSSTTSGTHLIASNLFNLGINHTMVHEKVLANNKPSQLKMLGYVLSEKLEILPELNTAIISLTNSELIKFNNEKGDTEGFVNYPLSISGIKLSAFFVERGNKIKISFRSKGSFKTNILASKYFEGGGHVNASGGTSYKSMKETLDYFKNVLTSFNDEFKSN